MSNDRGEGAGSADIHYFDQGTGSADVSDEEEDEDDDEDDDALDEVERMIADQER